MSKYVKLDDVLKIIKNEHFFEYTGLYDLPTVDIEAKIKKIDEVITDIKIYTDKFNYPINDTQHYRLGLKDGLEKAKAIILGGNK